MIGVVLGVHLRRKRFEHYVADRIRPFGGLIFYDYQVDGQENLRVGAPPPVPRWLAKLVGNDFFSRPARLSLSTPEANDSEMHLIGQLISLRVLLLGCRCVTRQGLVELGSLSHLRFLDLDGTPIDDDCLRTVANMPNLRILSLDYTHITDRSVPLLANCKSLSRLDLMYTPVTRSGYEQLKKALPDCHVYWKHTEVEEFESLQAGAVPCELIRKHRAERTRRGALTPNAAVVERHWRGALRPGTSEDRERFAWR